MIVAKCPCLQHIQSVAEETDPFDMKATLKRRLLYPRFDFLGSGLDAPPIAWQTISQEWSTA